MLREDVVAAVAAGQVRGLRGGDASTKASSSSPACRRRSCTRASKRGLRNSPSTRAPSSPPRGKAMASRPEEVRISRVIACFAPGIGAARPGRWRASRGTCRPSCSGSSSRTKSCCASPPCPSPPRSASPRQPRARSTPSGSSARCASQAASLERAIAAVLDPAALAWSFRVARASPANAVQAALAEGYAPALLIPPRGSLRAERTTVRRPQLSPDVLRELLAAARPVLILPW